MNIDDFERIDNIFMFKIVNINKNWKRKKCIENAKTKSNTLNWVTISKFYVYVTFSPT